MERRICVVFDIDDTLYLERDYVRSGFEAVGHWVAKCLHIGCFGERCWSNFLAGRRGSIFDYVLSEYGQQPTGELLTALVEVYRTHTPSIALARDAYDALNAISEIASISVVSDGPVASQTRKVDALGLRLFATPIVLTESLGSELRKPYPGAFEHVELCRPADTYLYVADNPLKDFTAPKALGWLTVRVRRPYGLYYAIGNNDITPDYEMSDCSGLLEVVADI
jgi:putative hydrolase of the HAD superfamily